MAETNVELDPFAALNRDAEFRKNAQSMQIEYKFASLDLLELITKSINDAAVHMILTRASEETQSGIFVAPCYLDNDLMGMYGIKLAAEIISTLQLNDGGFAYVNIEDTEL